MSKVWADVHPCGGDTDPTSETFQEQIPSDLVAGHRDPELTHQDKMVADQEWAPFMIPSVKPGFLGGVLATQNAIRSNSRWCNALVAPLR